MVFLLQSCRVRVSHVALQGVAPSAPSVPYDLSSLDGYPARPDVHHHVLSVATPKVSSGVLSQRDARRWRTPAERRERMRAQELAGLERRAQHLAERG